MQSNQQMNSKYFKESQLKKALKLRYMWKKWLFLETTFFLKTLTT